MKCTECGGKMAAKKENYLYQEESGLPVTLEQIEVLTCVACGDRGPVIPQVLDLHAAMVGVIARKKARLAGPEVRFLRSVVGRSGRALAKLMGATAVSVSRWETGAAVPGTQADKLLRLCAVLHVKDGDYSLDDVEAGATEDQGGALRFTLAYSRGAWRRAGEAREVRRVA